jgi:hypothetical protein
MFWTWLYIWAPLVTISFILLEGYALLHPRKQWTLSQTIKHAGDRWPLVIAWTGLVFGALLVHFFGN